MKTSLRYLPLFALLALAQACAYGYRAEVHQGNYITSEIVEQLEVGMTRDQVRDLLGVPLAQHPFRADRWDYVYHFDSKYRDNERSYVVVWFNGDEVSWFDTRSAPAR
jgi:outer membrane protein assembly factor BamE